MEQMQKDGWAIIPSGFPSHLLQSLREAAFISLGADAGQRCLLDISTVREAATMLKTVLIDRGCLASGASAIQAIAFDKTPDVNWKVTWHQDVMFPFAAPTNTLGYDLACKKHGVDYVRPPRAVLEALLAARLHLDNCHEKNGPLRVVSGSQTLGILKAKTISQVVDTETQTSCLANEGDLLLIKPLLLHASSPAQEPRHRRVLHFVFYDGPEIPERWFRNVP